MANEIKSNKKIPSGSNKISTSTHFHSISLDVETGNIESSGDFEYPNSGSLETTRETLKNTEEKFAVDPNGYGETKERPTAEVKEQLKEIVVEVEEEEEEQEEKEEDEEEEEEDDDDDDDDDDYDDEEEEEKEETDFEMTEKITEGSSETTETILKQVRMLGDKEDEAEQEQREIEVDLYEDNESFDMRKEAVEELGKIETMIEEIEELMEDEEDELEMSFPNFYPQTSKSLQEECSLFLEEKKYEDENDEEEGDDEEDEEEEEEEWQSESKVWAGDDESLEKISEDAWLDGLEPMDFLKAESVIEPSKTPSDKSGSDVVSSYSEVDEAPLMASPTSGSKDDVLSSKGLEAPEAESTTLISLRPERAKLEEEYRDAWFELYLAKEQNKRIQDQLVQVMCRTEKEYNEYDSDEVSLQERELYVKLFNRYVSLSRHWGEMEDLEKEEVIKHAHLQTEVDEMFESYIEKKVNTLVGKNRNEKSSKFQLANKLEEAERRKWAEANELQVANLAIKMQMEKLLQHLKQREVIGSNFTLMGYNQLKHDNLIAREVVAQKKEQCESVLRNTKISAQKMTHIKEKLNFVSQQYKTKVDSLYAKEKLCDQIYLELKEAKRARTKARQLLSSLQAKNDLLSYPELLMDYESGIEKTHRLKQHLGKMSYEYNSTVEHLKALTKKLRSIN